MKNLKLFSLVMLLTAFVLIGCGEQKTEEIKTSDTKTETKINTNTTTTPNSTTTESSTTSTTTTKVDTIKKDGTVTKDEPKTDATGHIMKIETTMGTIKAKLFANEAPMTVAHIETLVNKGFYNGIIFHRVIDGFMIQTGDPTGTGTGGSGTKIKDEFGQGLKHTKAGTLSMANSGPNTGDSQFFITLDATPWLDGKHAIFGEVIDGMDVVKKIGKVATDKAKGDRPVTEVKMTKVTMVNK
ncbi:hypothetical protein BH10BAC5_BH10BAC5_21180 [soil metagenome]